MLQRIETSEVMRRATQAFDAHNKACPMVTHTRNTSRGEIEVSRRDGIIPEAVTTTFHVLLTSYINNYNQMRDILPLGLQDPLNPPALRTNAARVAKYARCTDRTVRNHVRRLRELGFVTTKFHGSKSDFELWITPEYLTGGEQSQIAEIAPNCALTPIERKNFPDISTQIQTVETGKGNADTFFRYGESIQGQRGQTESTGEPLSAKAGTDREMNVAPGGVAGRAAIVAQNHQEREARAAALLESRKPKGPRGLDPKFLYMLFDFWLYAWKVIYPHREFSKEQQEKALVAISAGVYEDFAGDWTDEQWRSYQEIQMAKLDKAGRFYDNHPDAYRPDPYAVFIPGKGYFDAANLKGFIGIDAWIKKDSIKNARSRQAYSEKQEARTRRAETLLRTARRDFEKQRVNEPPRKEVKGKDQIALFQYYNVIFAGLGKKWQETFCKQYLDQQAHDFRSPSYLKPRKKRALAGEVSKATVVYVESWMEYGDYYDSE